VRIGGRQSFIWGEGYHRQRLFKHRLGSLRIHIKVMGPIQPVEHVRLETDAEQKRRVGQTRWLKPVISVTQKTEDCGSRPAPAKKFVRPYRN
jgi:hypothetical protein